jgi:hypothetical protein
MAGGRVALPGLEEALLVSSSDSAVGIVETAFCGDIAFNFKQAGTNENAYLDINVLFNPHVVVIIIIHHL